MNTHLVVGTEVIIILLLIVFNGVFAMSELALVSSRPSRLQQRVDEGRYGAAAALELSSDPSRFLSTVQIGITLIGIGTGAFGGATLAGPLSNVLDDVPGVGSYATQVATILVVISITYLTLIIGELVPKRLALQNPESMASIVAPTMRLLSRITAPVIWFLALSSDAVLTLLRAKGSNEPDVTEEEVEEMLRQGAEAGVFHESERALVAGIFDIGDRTASELMTPRHMMQYLDLAQSDEKNWARMAEAPHNFYPVCDGSSDNVVGVVTTRELWRRQVAGESTGIRDAMTPAIFVPELSPIFSVMETMRQQRASMVLVVDEHGGVEGLLTLNDVVGDIFGELETSEEAGITTRDDGSWLVDGVMPAHEVRERLDIESLPGEDERRFETIGGFVMDQLGHIPDAGEHVIHAGHRFEVMDMDGHRVDKIMIEQLDRDETRISAYDVPTR